MQNTARMLYLSAPRQPVDGVILDIVRSAEHRNQHMGISGMLLYSNRFFCQLLEGSRADVATLFARIDADPRHIVLHRVDLEATRREISTDLPMGYTREDLPIKTAEEFPARAPEIARHLVRMAHTLYPTRAKLQNHAANVIAFPLRPKLS